MQVCGGTSGWQEPNYASAISSYESSESSCDGLDNDCDGSVDTGLSAPSASLASGVCSGAVQVCGGTSGWQDPDYASLFSGYEPSESSCDGLDNDCDGSVDSGLTAPSASMTSGVCSGAVQFCGGTSGWQEPNYASLFSDFESSESTCDGLDNDCDGQTDEDFDLGEACDGVGECGIGLYQCSVSGGVICSTDPGGNSDGSVSETCDSLDNDCDGSVDENNVCATYSYANDIHPLWSSNSAGGCTGCHGGSGGLSLSGSASTVHGNLSSRIVAGDHASSRLWQKLSGTTAGTRMPKNGGTFTQAQQDMIATWIDEGAPNN